MNKNKITLFILYLIIFSFLSFLILNKVFSGYATLDSSDSSSIQKNGSHFIVNWVSLSKCNASKEPLTPNSILKMDGFIVKLNRTYAHINSGGFRGKDYPLKKDKNTFRIAVLGDSFAFGFEVNDNQTFEYLLEQQLNQMNLSKHYEIMNFAVPGYDAKREVRRFFDKAIKYHPDLVILFYFLNDYEDYCVSHNLFYLLGEKYNIRGPKAGQIINHQLLPGYYKWMYSHYSLEELFNERIFKYYDELISQKVPVLFVVFPDGKKEETILKKYFIRKHQRVLFLKEYGYKYEYPWIIAKEDTHPSPYAHKRIADILLNYLIKEKLITNYTLNEGSISFH